MFNWLKSLFKTPQPAGPPEEIASFNVADPVLCETSTATDTDGWRFNGSGKEESVRLFEIPDPGVEQCLLTYRAKLKTKNVEGKVYLEMWCKMAIGEFFSKGLQDVLSGTNDWATYEIPFYLKAGQRPSLLKLNLHIGQSGTVWIKDVQLFKTPLQ